mgnify:CR=1 FL=1
MAGIPGGETLHALVFAVLGRGLGALGEPAGLKPSLVQETGTGARTITTFDSPDLRKSLDAAREAARRSTAERVVLCWDGRLTGPDGEERAVMALAQERGQPQSLIFAQRYVPQGTGVERVGSPGFAGERAPLL